MIQHEPPSPMPPYRASCLCGAVALEIHGGIDAIIHCHCSRCRKSSGSAYATNGFIGRSGRCITHGEAQVRSYEVKPGR